MSQPPPLIQVFSVTDGDSMGGYGWAAPGMFAPLQHHQPQQPQQYMAPPNIFDMQQLTGIAAYVAATPRLFAGSGSLPASMFPMHPPPYSM
jgi:hypothetical protein